MKQSGMTNTLRGLVRAAWLILRMTAAVLLYLIVFGPVILLTELVEWWHYGPAQWVVDRLRHVDNLRGMWRWLKMVYRHNMINPNNEYPSSGTHINQQERK